MGGDNKSARAGARSLGRILDQPGRLATAGRRLGFRVLLRSGIGRRVVPRLLALTRRPSPLDLDRSVFRHVDQDAVLQEVRARGVFLGLNLPLEILAEIEDYVRMAECRGGFGDPGDARCVFRYADREAAQRAFGKTFIIAHYRAVASHCPAIGRLLDDPMLLSIATRYLGAPPAFRVAMLWWSFATAATVQERLRAAQTVHYHFDEFDYKFVYFNFYITEVDADAGPHVCVASSHVRKSLRQRLAPANQSDESIVAHYGSGSVLTITGPAGFGFVEDAYCYHKATPPSRRDRLFLQIRLALSGNIDQE